MSEDRKINIDIGTTADTAGAEAAEAALKKVTTAADLAADLERVKGELAAQHAEEMAKIMADAKQWSEDVSEGLGKIGEELDGIAEAGEGAKEEAGKLGENVSEITQAQKGRAIADLAGNVGLIGRKFKEAASEVREFDVEAADKLQATGERIEAVSGAVSQMALGFAVGGPLGAGVAALGVGIGVLVNNFKEAEVAAIRAAAEQKKAFQEAAEAARDAAAEARQRADALASDEIEAGIKRQNEALAEGLALVEKQIAAARRKRQEAEEIFQAEDKLKLAQIDESEAKGGLSKEEAATQRARVEQGAVERARAERKRKAIEDAEKAAAAAAEKGGIASGAETEAGAKEAEAKSAAEAAAEARKSAEDVARRDAIIAAENKVTGLQNTVVPRAGLKGEIRDAMRERDAAREEADKITTRNSPALTGEAAGKIAAQEEANAKSLADAAAAKREASDAARKAADDAKAESDRISGESAGTIATVDRKGSLEDETKETQRRAVAARDESKRRADEKKKADDQAKRDEAGRASDRSSEEKDFAKDAKTAGRDAVKLLPKGVQDAFRKKVEAAAGALEDGAQGAELADLIAPLERLAAAASNKADRSAVGAVLKRLENLEERMRRKGL